MAASKGFAVGDVVTDLDVSGAKHPLERPGMARALEEIKAGRAGGIVAHDLFRITREPAHGAWLAEEISAADGVMLAPDLGEDIMSPVGEFAFAVYLDVGKLYRRQVGERFETVKRNAAREGIRIGAPLLGYTKDEHRRMVVDNRPGFEVAGFATSSRSAAKAASTTAASKTSARIEARAWQSCERSHL